MKKRIKSREAILLRTGPPSMQTTWDGLKVTEQQTNMLLHQPFMLTMMAEVDVETRKITIFPTNEQKGKIISFLARPPLLVPPRTEYRAAPKAHRVSIASPAAFVQELVRFNARSRRQHIVAG